MSSHHIVKEGQEPALIIASVLKNNSAFFEQLLEWSPTVVVLESAIEDVLSWGLKMDVVVVQEQKIQQYIDQLREQAPVKILSCSNNTEALPTALYFLAAEKQRAVNIVGVSIEMLNPFLDRLDIVVFENETRWSSIRQGKFEKWLLKGTQLKVKTVDDSVVVRKGLDPGDQSLEDGIVHVQCNSPFWIGENY